MSPEMIDALSRIAANVGFPALLVFYLLFRHERILQGLQKAIERLTDVIENVERRLDILEDRIETLKEGKHVD